jgi:hypothetical protein
MLSSERRRPGATKNYAVIKPIVSAIGRMFASPMRRPATVHPPARNRKLSFEALESRILMSGDLNPVAVTGSIDVPGETDRYAFTLDADTKVVFDSQTNSSTPPCVRIVVASL